MDIKAEKDYLIKVISHVRDSGFIERIIHFVKANQQDFWLDLSESEKQEIVKATDELDRGERFDYKEFISHHSE